MEAEESSHLKIVSLTLVLASLVVASIGIYGVDSSNFRYSYSLSYSKSANVAQFGDLNGGTNIVYSVTTSGNSNVSFYLWTPFLQNGKPYSSPPVELRNNSTYSSVFVVPVEGAWYLAATNTGSGPSNITVTGTLTTGLEEVLLSSGIILLVSSAGILFVVFLSSVRKKIEMMD